MTISRMHRPDPASVLESVPEGFTPGPWHLAADGENITQTSHVTRDVWTIPRTVEDMALCALAPTLVAALRVALEQREAARREQDAALGVIGNVGAALDAADVARRRRRGRPVERVPRVRSAGPVAGVPQPTEMSMSRFWSHDLDTFDTHDTAERAKARAEGALDQARDESADGGWPEETTNIRWGIVLGAVVKTSHKTVEDLEAEGDEYTASQMRANGWDYFATHDLVEPAGPPYVDALRRCLAVGAEHGGRDEDACAAAWAAMPADDRALLERYACRVAEVCTDEPTQAVEDVLAEREKQRAKYGDAHDDHHDCGELAIVAASLADPESEFDAPDKYHPDDWGYIIGAKHRDDRRKRLVIATALLIAEIERMDRANPPEAEGLDTTKE